MEPREESDGREKLASANRKKLFASRGDGHASLRGKREAAAHRNLNNSFLRALGVFRSAAKRPAAEYPFNRDNTVRALSSAVLWRALRRARDARAKQRVLLDRLAYWQLVVLAHGTQCGHIAPNSALNVNAAFDRCRTGAEPAELAQAVDDHFGRLCEAWAGLPAPVSAAHEHFVKLAAWVQLESELDPPRSA